MNKKLTYAVLSIVLLLSFAYNIILASPTTFNQYYASKNASFIIYNDGETYVAASGLTGAVAYSGTDASTVIQNAINAIGTAGGTIHITSGIYPLKSTLHLGQKYVIIQGEGVGTTTLRHAGDVVNLTNANYAFNYFQALRDLTIDGVDKSGIGILGYQVCWQKEVLRNVRIINCDIGFYLNYSWGGTIYNLAVEYCNTGIRIERVSGFKFFAGASQNCRIGVHLVGGTGNSFYGMDIESNSDYDIDLESTSATRTDNNTFENCWLESARDNHICVYMHGVLTEDPSQSDMIRGCTVSLYGRNSTFVYSQYSQGLQIRDNMINTDVKITLATNAAYSMIAFNRRNNWNIPTITVINNGWANKFVQNDGIATENSGTATGTSPIVVAHGLAGTPTIVTLGVKDVHPYSVSWTANSTHIMIYHSAKGKPTVTWYAEYKP